MKSGDRHGGITQRVNFASFHGGMNTGLPPDRIKEDQCQLLVNWEYDRNYSVLRTRDGSAKYCDVGSHPVTGLCPALDGSYLLAAMNGHLYKLSGSPVAATDLGALTGASRPQFVHWGDSGQIFIASGGALQIYDGTSLSTAGGNYASFGTSITGDNNDLTWKAKRSGTSGNSISVTYTSGGSLAVSVSGNDITVTFVASTTTASQVKAAVEGSTAASALVTCHLATGNTGAGTVGAISKTNLAGGESAPECDILLSRLGRLVCAKTGTSSLKFSGVGDPEMWKYTGISSDAQEITEVGYKDGLSIVAVAPISQDLVVCKGDGNRRRGIVYRLAGTTPATWAVYEVGRDALPCASNAIATVGNDLMVLDWRGVRSIATTDAYGSLKVGGGSPVDLLLSAEASTNAFVAPLPTRAHVWVVPAQDKAYVLDTSYGAWIQWDFPFGVASVTNYGTTVYVGTADGDVFRLDSSLYTDGGTAIRGVATLRELAPGVPMIIKRYGLRYEVLGDAAWSLVVGPSTLAKTGSAQSSDVAYSDTDPSYTDPDPLTDISVVRRERRVNFETEAVAPQLTTHSGRMSLLGVWLDFVPSGR